MLHNFDLVSLSVTLPEHGLLPGALGTVLAVFTDPRVAYEVEFGGQDGLRPPHVMLGPDQVRRLS
ncbi:DUF4926 domain-containing protein [Kineosporia rhizophila]|uniref:DUF4926 domain-containing protein n=1 Tax=Kineosporia TaxID=49184 RepID=UPI001E439AA6|nr:DUF4926 domain-containing protein [Kineosporia sp. NBRC 101677]MCE0534140.1 DUF4926 domain-containing protein [Kineosporia rhizophila]